MRLFSNRSGVATLVTRRRDCRKWQLARWTERAEPSCRQKGQLGVLASHGLRLRAAHLYIQQWVLVCFDRRSRAAGCSARAFEGKTAASAFDRSWPMACRHLLERRAATDAQAMAMARRGMSDGLLAPGRTLLRHRSTSQRNPSTDLPSTCVYVYGATYTPRIYL